MNTRIAKESDIPELVKIRVAFSNAIRKIDNSEQYAKATETYLREHFNDGSLLVMLTEDKDVIVSIAILCISSSLPKPSLLTGKEGLLLNMYTNPDYRRQGHAANLLKALFVEAKKLDVNKINLSYTEMGYPLYVSLGFEKKNEEMCKYI